jgi:hypothetical protein
MLLEMLLDQNRAVIRRDLENVIEQIFVAVADANELGPFDLILRISAQGEKALGEVFTSKKKLLYDFDAGAEIQKLFDLQLQRVPEIAKKAVVKRMGNQTVGGQISKALEAGAILIRYNNDCEMKYYRQLDKKLKLIDIEDFFANISL